MENIKKKLKNNLQYNWWIYLAFALIIIILWSSLFSYLERPARNEKVIIEFFDPGLDTEGLNALLEAEKETITEQYTKRIKAYTAHTTLPTVGDLLVSRVMMSDIIIIPEELLVPNQNGVTILDAVDFFYELPTEQLTGIWNEKGYKGSSEFEYYAIDGTNYGIYLSLNGTDTNVNKNNIEKHYTGDKRFVVFFSSESESVGGIFGNGKVEDTAAIDTLAFLLGGE